MSNSLLITAELCAKHGFPLARIDLITKLFPNGFTFEAACRRQTRYIPIEYIHDAYMKFPLTEEDKKMYLEFAQIKDSTAFSACYDIEKCHMISGSKFCKGSSFIFASDYVENSKGVLSSQEIQDSKNVCRSSTISGSTEVLGSKDVSFGNIVIESTNVIASSNIAYCDRIDGSIFLLECDNVSKSGLSRKLSNCVNKMFCYGISDSSEPMIFNKPVSPMRFDSAAKTLRAILADKRLVYSIGRGAIFDTDKSSYRSLDDIIPNCPIAYPAISIFPHTFGADSSLWSEIRDLIPGYDKELLYQITYSKEV